MIRFTRLAQALVAAALALTVMALPAVPAAADSIRDREWYLEDLDIVQAHRISEGAGVTVALIDSGVNADHQDLRGAVLTGANVNPGGKDDGRTDNSGHGTAMAGIIAGRGHGAGAGVLGIAPEAKILPIAAPTEAITTTTFLGAAIDFAIAHRAGVINMSFGFDSADEGFRAAIQKAAAANIVLIASAGNKGEPGGYPGRFPEVLAVGAYGQGEKVASFSISGPQVRIAAPGVDIVTTGDHGADQYVNSSGTSDATAIVSGAAALVRAKYPQLSAAEIVHRLTATAIDAGPKGRDDSYGYGRLDIVEALTADVPPLSSGATATPAGKASTAAGPLAEPDDLPAAKSPALLVAIIVGLLAAIGVVVVFVLVRRSARRT